MTKQVIPTLAMLILGSLVMFAVVHLGTPNRAPVQDQSAAAGNPFLASDEQQAVQALQTMQGAANLIVAPRAASEDEVLALLAVIETLKAACSECGARLKSSNDALAKLTAQYDEAIAQRDQARQRLADHLAADLFPPVP